MNKTLVLFTNNTVYDKVCEYLYNKYNDRKLLCKHYLYECNISNDNDIFNLTIK